MDINEPMRGADWCNLLLKSHPELKDMKALGNEDIWLKSHPELKGMETLGIENSILAFDDDIPVFQEILMGIGFIIGALIMIAAVITLGLLLIWSINSATSMW
jgi:hypothetical protein